MGERCHACTNPYFSSGERSALCECGTKRAPSARDILDADNAHLVRWNGNVIALHRLANLASCLRSAAFGQAMFDAGVGYEMYQDSLRHRNAALFSWNWRPGCGRALAGWEGTR